MTGAETALSEYRQILDFDHLATSWPSTAPLDDLGVHRTTKILAGLAAVIVLVEMVLAGQMGFDRADSLIDAPWMRDNLPEDDEQVEDLLDDVEEIREVIGFSGPDVRPDGDVGWWQSTELTLEGLRERLDPLTAGWSHVVNGRVSR